MKKKNLFRTFVASFILASFASCVNDVDVTNISGDIVLDHALVMPIGETEFSIQDMLDQLELDSTITTEGNAIIFQFSDSFQFNFRDVKIAEMTHELTLSKEFPAGTFPANTTLPTVEFSDKTIDLGINNNSAVERIDSVKCKSAKLSFRISVNDIYVLNPSDLKFKVIFPAQNLKLKNGDNSVNYVPTSLNQFEDIEIEDFVIYTQGTSEIPLTLMMDITTGSLPVIAGANANVSIQMKIKDVDYEVVWGFFKPSQAATSTETIALDLEEYLPYGLLKFANPQVNLKARTNVGVKMKFSIDYFKAYRDDDASYEPVYASFENNSPSTSVTLDLPQLGKWSETQLPQINNQFGKIDRLFDKDPRPNVLEYKFSADNDNTPDDNVVNFITPDGEVNIYADIRIPFHLKAGSYYEMKDTIKSVNLNVDSILSEGTVERFYLVLNVSNGLPVKADFQMKFLDENGAEINTTIKKQYTLQSPNVDTNGKVVYSSVNAQQIVIELNKTNFDEAKNIKDIAYTLRVDSNEGKAIQFQTTDFVKVKAGVYVKVKSTFSNSSND